MTVFQDSRRVDIFLSETPMDYRDGVRVDNYEYGSGKPKKARVESRVSHVVDGRCFRVAPVD